MEQEFFTQNELERFTEIAGKPYDANREEHQTYRREIIQPLLEKTEYWAKLAAWQMPDFDWKPSSTWLVYGRYRPYTWARIFRNSDRDKGIFFTVGLDNKEGLIAKLDYHYEGQSPLSEEQIEQCHTLIGHDKAKWKTIRTSELTGWNWKDLTDETVQYFASRLGEYDSAIAKVHGIQQ